MTSAAPWHRAISAGRRCTCPFQIRRATSKPQGVRWGWAVILPVWLVWMIRGRPLGPTRTFTPCSRGGSGAANTRRGPGCLRKRNWRTNSAAGPTPRPGRSGHCNATGWPGGFSEKVRIVRTGCSSGLATMHHLASARTSRPPLRLYLRPALRTRGEGPSAGGCRPGWRPGVPRRAQQSAGDRPPCRQARAARQSPGSVADRAAAPGSPGAAIAGRVALSGLFPRLPSLADCRGEQR
jgi:hypothetical protein